MINLLINEFIKTFKRKGFIILLIIMAVFAVLTNLLYKELDTVNAEPDDEYIVEEYKSAKKTYESGMKNREDTQEYLVAKNEYDLYEFKNKFEDNSWQKAYIAKESYALDYIETMNRYELKLSDDKESYDLAKSNLNSLEKKLKETDWKDIVKEDKIKYQEKLDLINEALNKIPGEKKYKYKESDVDIIYLEKDELVTIIPTLDVNSLLGGKKELEIIIDCLNLQLEKNISYSDSLMNDVQSYLTVRIQLLKYDGIDINNSKLSKEELKEYYELREQYFKLNYSLKNSTSSKSIDLLNIIEEFYENFLLFIVIFIFMVAGPIVSQEFSKGTIKQLLVKPYSRTKILLSKYIVTLSSIIIAIIAMFVLEILIGGLFFGFGSLSNKAVVYSSVTDSASYFSIIKYFILISIAKLPHFIILATLTFAMSSITNNTAVSMITGFVAYVGTNILTMLLTNINKTWIKYFVGLNWDFKSYVFKLKPSIEGLSLSFSILICLVYFLVFIIPAFIVFKHKDIKNI